MTSNALKAQSQTRDEILPVAVVDIGSNSVRLVVFDVYDRALRPLFNEKVLCGLGRGMSKDNRLNPQKVSTQAKESILRFTRLVDAMGVKRLDMIATAAVRDAVDGPDFVTDIERIASCPVRVLDGAEEGRLSATGVSAGLSDAEGVVADLGGGSLELVELKDGQPGRSDTLPLGPFRLIELCKRDVSAMRREIDEQLSKVDWIETKVSDGGVLALLYSVGGAWRNLARLHMEQHSYPLHVIHGYRMRRAEVEDIESVVGRMGPRSLARIKDISRRRLETLPVAAVILGRVLKAFRFKSVIFSAYGLREGHIFQALSKQEQERDPLMVASEEMATRGARFGGMSQELMDWTTPLFPDEDKAQKRLRRASCLLSDIAWREHVDYRAEQALQRVLYHPFSGLTHSARVFLAFTIFTRYGGSETSKEIVDYLAILSGRAKQPGTRTWLGATTRLSSLGGNGRRLE